MKTFSVAELTVTSLDVRNEPTTVAHQKNLERLARDVLSPLYANAGPFTIESAYRSEAVNKAVGGSATSFHAQGLAADLVPAMGAEKFLATIEASPALRSLVGELILNSKRVVHVSAPALKSYATSYRSPAGKYVPYTAEELKAVLAKYGLVAGIGAAAFLVIGAAIYFANGGKL